MGLIQVMEDNKKKVLTKMDGASESRLCLMNTAIGKRVGSTERAGVPEKGVYGDRVTHCTYMDIRRRSGRCRCWPKIEWMWFRQPSSAIQRVLQIMLQALLW